MTFITLLSDFGDEPWAAVLHGALLREAPAARIVSLTHRLDPFDLRGAALWLRRAAFAFPPLTIHLVGLDPDWGTRGALLAESAGQRFLAADNGVLTPVLLADRAARVWRIAHLPHAPLPPRPLFLARDVLVPLAAALVAGADPGALGEPWEDWRRIDWPRPCRDGSHIKGEILHCDRFGNLLTNLTPDLLSELVPQPAPAMAWELHLGSVVVRAWRGSESAATPFAYWGADGWLEIALHGASAAVALGVGPGAPVEVRLLK